ncbi:hypothetical protein [Thiorhodococcus minor]|uniref:hypothetical protein n=1 Tax=Thiorhodococcus minor TaxID=57489 RepID=UPI001ADB4E83|nr:hypothetical protein [Thiorhodococcus minor]
MTQRCAGCALHIASAPRAQPSALRRYARAHTYPGPLGCAALSMPRGVEAELATKTDLRALELALKSDIRELEYRLIIKLGAMMAVAIAAVATLAKVL